MIKRLVRDDAVLVTFELPVAVAADSVSVCGDFNDWSPTTHPLARTEAGFQTSVELAAGQRCRFRYLLDGSRWENDWAADEYVGNEFGGTDSVVDLTDTWMLLPPVGGAAAGGGRSGSRTRRKAAASDASTSATLAGTGKRATTGSATKKAAGTRGKPAIPPAQPSGRDG